MRRLAGIARDVVLAGLVFYPLAALAAAIPVTLERAPTIANSAPQSLWDYLKAFPGSFESQQFYGVMLGGTVGMLAHYLLKWARDEIKGNLFCYLWEFKKSTALSFFAFVGIALTAVMQGVFFGEGGAFVGWKLVLWMGATNGFTIDAIANKTARVEWDEWKRWQKQVDQEPKK